MRGEKAVALFEQRVKGLCYLLARCEIPSFHCRSERSEVLPIQQKERRSIAILSKELSMRSIRRENSISRRRSQAYDLSFPNFGDKGNGQVMMASYNEVEIEKDQ